MRLHKMALILSAMIKHMPAPLVLNFLLPLVRPYVFAGRGHHATPPAVGVRRPASLPWHVPQDGYPCQGWANPRRAKGQGKAGKLPGDAGA